MAINSYNDIIGIIKKTESSVRFEWNENFEVFFKYLVLKFNGNLRYIETSLEFFDQFYIKNRNEKLQYYKNIVEILKDDKRNFLEQYPEFRKKLYRHYSELRCNLKDNLDSDEKLTKEDLLRLKEDIKDCIQASKKPYRKIFKSKNSITYSSLFINPEHPQKLKELLLQNDYLNNDFSWKGTTQKKNELAIAFYVLREDKFGIKAIKHQDDNKNQIICFYKEFGLKVKRNSEEEGHVTYYNISVIPKNRETIQKFKLLFAKLNS